MNHYEGDENSVSTGVGCSSTRLFVDNNHCDLLKGLRDYGC